MQANSDGCNDWVKNGLVYLAIANQFKAGPVCRYVAETFQESEMYRVDDRSPIDLKEESVAYALQSLGLVRVFAPKCRDITTDEDYKHAVVDMIHPPQGMLCITSAGEDLCRRMLDIDCALKADGLTALALTGPLYPEGYEIGLDDPLHEDDHGLDLLYQRKLIRFSFPTCAAVIALTASGNELYQNVASILRSYLGIPIQQATVPTNCSPS